VPLKANGLAFCALAVGLKFRYKHCMITPKRPMMFALPLVGWKEAVSFPKLKLGPVVAKIDTGARTSALHADVIEVKGRRVRFVIDGKKYAAPLTGFRRVKSSNGFSEMRPVIRATIQLGAKAFKTEMSLTDRTDMDVPMLLGRNTITGLFVVNPGKTFLLTKRPAP
jgi:hypothetical protein